MLRGLPLTQYVEIGRVGQNPTEGPGEKGNCSPRPWLKNHIMAPFLLPVPGRKPLFPPPPTLKFTHRLRTSGSIFTPGWCRNYNRMEVETHRSTLNRYTRCKHHRKGLTKNAKAPANWAIQCKHKPHVPN